MKDIQREELVQQVREHLPSLLFLCDDEMAFEKKFGKQAAATPATVLYAVYAADVPELTVDPLIEKLRDYLHAKTTQSSHIRKQDAHMITLSDDIIVQPCEIADFMSQLARGSPRAVDLVMGDCYVDTTNDASISSVNTDTATFRIIFNSTEWQALWTPTLEQGHSFRSTGYFRSCAGQAYGLSRRMEGQSSTTDQHTLATARGYAMKLLTRGSDANVWEAPEIIETSDFSQLRSVATVCSDVATVAWKADEKQRRGFRHKSGSIENRSGFRCVDASVEHGVDEWFNSLRDAASARFLTSSSSETETETETEDRYTRDTTNTDSVTFNTNANATNSDIVNTHATNPNTTNTTDSTSNINANSDATITNTTTNNTTTNNNNSNNTNNNNNNNNIDVATRTPHSICKLEETLRVIDSPIAATEVVMLLRCGSYMYNLHKDGSDMDFYMVFVSETRDLLNTVPPRNSFEKHVSAAMGSDKSGEVEYFGREYGSFLVEMCKGNPKNLELLFCDPSRSVYESEDFAVLRQHRDIFVTNNCIRQYYGFIKERLGRVTTMLEKSAQHEPLKSTEEDAISKLLYHAYHKLFDLQQIVNYNPPTVWYDETSDEYKFIMGIRKTRPLLHAHAHTLVTKALSMLSECKETHKTITETRVAQGLAPHPENVSVEAVRSLLTRARRRHLKLAEADVGRNISDTSIASSISMVSSEDVVRARLFQLEKEENIKVLYAAECSSRMLGTSHAGSDHDIIAIFVFPTERYFSLRTIATSIRKTYEATSDVPEVDITVYECRHAFKLLSESNLAVLDAFMSPIVYVEVEKPVHWCQQVRSLIRSEYDLATVAMAAYQHAQGNYKSAIEKQAPENVLLKKYVHVSRRILFAMWLILYRERQVTWPPPLRVRALLNSIPAVIEVTDRTRLEVPVEVRQTLETILRDENLPQLAEKGNQQPVLDVWIKSSFVSLKPHLFSKYTDTKGRKDSTSMANWDELLMKLSQTVAATL